jgi:uncharacterized protein involved in type VI secretion and phage assembly
MELPLGCSDGQSRYTYEADASTAHEPEAAAGAGDLRPARVGVPEVKYKRNALRLSFGSYRMEMVKNAGQVALEMGNSPAIVMKHYFHIVEARAAKEYWNIRPLPRGDSRKIVSMR